MSTDSTLDALLARFGTDTKAVSEIEKGGSGRRFFRTTPPGHGTVILCVYDDSRAENQLYANIALFLRDTLGMPVPRVIEWHPGQRTILLEDLGESDLWSLGKADEATRMRAWGDALVSLAKLHSPASLAAWEKSGVHLMDGFGPELYQWERDYFRDNALRHLLRRPLDAERAAALEAELAALADRLCAHPRALVHRDCQSQNILWKDGRAHFIDFQGMRVGSAFYDLGSLLFDPYVEFTHGERARLLGDYAEAAGLTRTPAFIDAFHDASAQRLMQALGAYHFLAHVKGKTEFLAHVRPALGNLVLAAKSNRRLPVLAELAVEIYVTHFVAAEDLV